MQLYRREVQVRLEFVNSFPAAVGLESAERISLEMNLEAADRVLHGYQMLQQFLICTPMDLQMIDACFGLGGEAALIGFPMEDGSMGSSFQPSRALGMSSVCENKEAAWQVLRELLLPQYKSVDSLGQKDVRYLWQQGIPVNRSDYDLLIRASSSGKLNQAMQGATMAGFPGITYRAATRTEIARFEDLLNSIETIMLYDRTVFDIAYEVAGSYFMGDKTLDEAAQLIQDRVNLYLDEQM